MTCPIHVESSQNRFVLHTPSVYNYHVTFNNEGAKQPLRAGLEMMREQSSLPIKALVLDTWAGRRYYAVEVLGETAKKTRARVLTPGGVMLPGRRYLNCGDETLVPKHAVVDLPTEQHKIEQGYYDGHLAGYGGIGNAR